MSLRDDTIIRDERGRIVKGSPGLHRKQEQDPQSEPSPDQDALPTLDTSFDDDLIAASESFGKPRTKTGRRGYCEWLRDQRPIEFAALLSKALTRKAEAASPANAPRVEVIQIGMVPSNHFISGDQMEMMWRDLYGNPAPPVDEPVKPQLVTVPPIEEPLAENEIEFGGPEAAPEPSPCDRGGNDMNELWRRNTRKPKWTNPRDGW